MASLKKWLLFKKLLHNLRVWLDFPKLTHSFYYFEFFTSQAELTMLLKRGACSDLSPWEAFLCVCVFFLLFRFISARKCWFCGVFRVALPNTVTKLKRCLQKKPHSSINLLMISVYIFGLLLFAGLGRVLT